MDLLWIADNDCCPPRTILFKLFLPKPSDLNDAILYSEASEDIAANNEKQCIMDQKYAPKLYTIFMKILWDYKK